MRACLAAFLGSDGAFSRVNKNVKGPENSYILLFGIAAAGGVVFQHHNHFQSTVRYKC